MRWPGTDLSSLVDDVLARPGPVRLVAVDGRGGAGKTTFAAALADAAGGAPIVHTDDYADAAGDAEWWPELLARAIEPLTEGRVGAVEPAPIVIIEGVSAGRVEWAHHLSVVIWVETPTSLRRERMVTRDGPSVSDVWASYEAEEDEFFARDPVWDRADVVVRGG